MALSQFLDILREFGRLVRPGHGDPGMFMPRRLYRQAPHTFDDLPVRVFRVGIGRHPLFQESTAPAPREIHLAQIGNIHHRRHAPVILHQGDIDRKLVVSLDKLHRSVQRVHQPEQLPVAALFVPHLTPLFAQNRNTGRSQIGLDRFVRPAVRDGNRSLVALNADVVILLVFVNLHNGRTGPHRRIEKVGQKV